jgi:hypothetical protein
MDRVRKLLASRAAPLVVALILGVGIAFVLIGPGPLSPSNTAWLFGDAATYYSGWEQYRHDPHLHFPLPWTERIGYPVGTSIALLDAIPLAAVVLRPFSPLLPEPFQYLGLWMLLSLVLQAYFAFSLCRRLFPSDAVFALLGSILLVVSAPLLFRVCGHIALTSHWLLLAGLDAYFRDPGARPVRWLARGWIVLALAAAINPYMAAMCLIVVLGCIGRLALERRSPWWQVMLFAAVTTIVVIASGTTLGALVSGDSGTYRAPGYGWFSLNLNAPINPMRSGSLLLPSLPLAHSEQYEGYSYLGLGIIALLVINLVRRPASVRWLLDRRLAPLAGVALACTALAVSTSVTFGARTLFTIQLPDALNNAVQGLRASGRLFWPAYYLICLGAISLTFWVMKPQHRLTILAAALVIQVADLIPLYTKTRAVCDARFDNLLRSPAWNGLGRQYDNLIMIPAYQCDPFKAAGGIYNYVYFGKLAAIERLRLNNYYAARYTHAELQAHCVDLLRAQLDGNLDPRSVYVVNDKVLAVWQVHGMRSHRCQRADGNNLCTPVPPTESDYHPPPVPAAPPYALGTVLDFTKGDDSVHQYLTYGWWSVSGLETWTEGPLAMLRLGLDRTVDTSRALDLEIDAVPLLAPQRHPKLDVDVFVNGTHVAQWSYDVTSWTRRQHARIPGVVAATRPGLDVEFRVRNPESPWYLGTRMVGILLGLNVRSLVVR